MKDIASLPLDQQQKLFIDVAEKGNFISPIFIERDFWCCWILQQIFSPELSEKSPVLFLKGSFAAVKAYEKSNRIYGDVDLMMNRDDLGFDEDIFQLIKQDTDKVNDYKHKIFAAKAKYITDTLYPALLEKADTSIPGAWSIKINRPFDPYISFDPPRALPGRLYSTSKIDSWIKVDFDVSASHYETDNVEHRHIQPFVAQHPLFKGEYFSVKMPTHNLIETFWDKVCGLHFTAHLSKEEVHHNLRFNWLRVADYYDLALFYQAGLLSQALKHHDLLEYIRLRKQVFYYHNDSAGAAFKRGSLRLVPNADVLADIGKLYTRQITCFHGQPMTFEQAIDLLRELEELIN